MLSTEEYAKILAEILAEYLSPNQQAWGLIHTINDIFSKNKKMTFNTTPKNLSIFEVFKALDKAGFKLNYKIIKKKVE